MCGRFKLKTEQEQLTEYFEAEAACELAPRYNIAPTQQIATVRCLPESNARILTTMRWGLVPFWAKDVSIGYKMINARSETVLEKPAYRESFKNRRCLVPADGFYEWKKEGKNKQAFHIGMKDDSVFAFAGIWDTWKTPEGQAVESCSILTTAANALLTDVHDRMPVILHRNQYQTWLTAPPNTARELAGLLLPYAAESMRFYEVGPLVNSLKNDFPECCQTLSAGIIQKSRASQE